MKEHWPLIVLLTLLAVGLLMYWYSARKLTYKPYDHNTVLQLLQTYQRVEIIADTLDTTLIIAYHPCEGEALAEYWYVEPIENLHAFHKPEWALWYAEVQLSIVKWYRLV